MASTGERNVSGASTESRLGIGIEPATVNGLRALLALQDDQFSRLIALAIVSNGLLWLAVFYLRVRWTDLRGQLDRLARGACLTEFQRVYPEADVLAPILVLIPAYNEEDNIGSVLRKMPDRVCGLATSVLVIDDGSRDQTTRAAREAGALAIRSPTNRGGGAALRAGFDIGTQLGSGIVVTMDADGQHDPGEMERLVQPIVDDRFDFVIGSRLIGEREKDSAVRLAGIYFFNAVIRLLTTASVTDCSNGYRALRLAALDRSVRSLSRAAHPGARVRPAGEQLTALVGAHSRLEYAIGLPAAGDVRRALEQADLPGGQGRGSHDG